MHLDFMKFSEAACYIQTNIGYPIFILCR